MTSVELLAVHDRFTEWVGAGVPVPVSASVIVGDSALLVIVNVALADAAVCGLKVMVNAALCPDGIVTGRERPPTLRKNCSCSRRLRLRFRRWRSNCRKQFHSARPQHCPMAGWPGSRTID